MLTLVGYTFAKVLPSPRITYLEDVRTAFTWNTKQLYVFVAAEYSTPERPSNKVILWDEVLNSKEEGLFRLRARRSDYPLVDPYNGLKYVWNANKISPY
mmetsp:Transcript_46166/g.118966  ORF Transcript_46166/g.118966 Transcript_46166/m.118966 type:complete len:99 (-) Transcript_46166:742-1038(-)